MRFDPFVLFVSFCVSPLGLSNSRADIPDPIALPAVNVIEESKDFSFALPEEWVREIQASMASTDYDVAVQAEYTMLRKPKGKPQVPSFKFVTFRDAKRVDRTRRMICIIQNELPESGIAEKDIGRIVDGARHCDGLFKDGSAFVSYVAEGPLGLSEDHHETTEERMLGVLQRRMFFDPCMATTVGLTQIASGHAMDLSRHSVLKKVIRGTLRRGKADHVLIEIGSVKQIITFRDKVPVQMVNFVDIDKETQKPIPFERTMARWVEVADGFRVPTGIWAQRDHKWNSGNLISELSWTVGDKVDQRLFIRENMGEISAVRNQEL